jgi:hypothetical protein
VKASTGQELKHGWSEQVKHGDACSPTIGKPSTASENSNAPR